MFKQITFAALITVMLTAPAAAFDCPAAWGSSIYNGVPGSKLRSEPRDDAPVVREIDPTSAVAVLNVKPSCKLPEGWLRADHMGASGYIQERDLRPRASMPE